MKYLTRINMHRYALLVFLLSVVDLASSCEVGWLRLGDKCYMFSHTPASWGEAQGICTGFRAKLAEPMTTEESSFLSSHGQNLHASFWIGISDIIEEGRWVYSTTLQPITVTNFQPGQPDQHTAGNCVHLWSAANEKWADGDCTARLFFICELDNKSSGESVIG